MATEAAYSRLPGGATVECRADLAIDVAPWSLLGSRHGKQDGFQAVFGIRMAWDRNLEKKKKVQFGLVDMKGMFKENHGGKSRN